MKLKLLIEAKIPLKPVLIKIVPHKKGYPKRGLFQCRGCCNTFETTLYKVKIGHTKSCGCYQVNSTILNHTKHGHSSRKLNTPTYITWQNMLQRCNNMNHPSYPEYGYRGIKVCTRWNRFENFLEDMGERPTNKSIERIKNNKGYTKNNCKWGSAIEQNNNTRKNLLFEFKGVACTLPEIIRKSGTNVKYNTLRYRLTHGWSVDNAIK